MFAWDRGVDADAEDPDYHLEREWEDRKPERLHEERILQKDDYKSFGFRRQDHPSEPYGRYRSTTP